MYLHIYIFLIIYFYTRKKLFHSLHSRASVNKNNNYFKKREMGKYIRNFGANRARNFEARTNTKEDYQSKHLKYLYICMLIVK